MASRSEEILKQVNFWRKYRERNAIDLDEVAKKKLYRTYPYKPLTLQPLSPPKIRDFDFPPGHIPPRQLIPSNQRHRDFLSKKIPGMPMDPAHWKGKRFLGEGGQAVAGMWEWNDPPNITPPEYKQIVVKELLPGSPNDTLANESMVFQWTNLSFSEHLLKMRHQSYILKQGSDEGLGPEWDGVYIRIFLEYCNLGSLEDLLHKRITEQKPFSEKSLWLILLCLVDGLCVMQYGTELGFDGTAAFYPPWTPLIHFDIKPDNVLLADTEPLHTFTPISKFIDFGLASFIDPNNLPDDDELERLRRRGTEDYYTPEQFTDQWDASDWDQSTIAGQYSFYSNI